VQFAKDLEYLVTYPYGCVEQTVSAAFPQLYYADLAKALSGADVDEADNAENVNEAIRKLKLMQLYNGGLTYWSGSGEESWWGTVYATHFLIEAKKLGYDVDESFLNLMLSYLEMKLKEKSTITYYYNSTMKKEIAPKSVAYSLFVLAVANKPNKTMMNYYKSNKTLLSLDSKYLLAASYALIGDKVSYLDLLPLEFSGEVSVPIYNEDLYSPIRDEAISLYALLEADSENQQIAIIAKHLSEKMSAASYMSTQERVYGFLAMGKIAKLAEASNISATIKADGKEIAKYNNTLLTLKTKDLTSNIFDIITTGVGKLYYFWEAEGISTDGSYNEEDKYLQARRYFYTPEGEAITNNKFEQGDLVLVRVTIKGSSTTVIDNVVVTDILPAGFEIETAQVSTIPGVEIPVESSYPQYLDVRDDRISFFGSVDATEKSYYYLVRAVTKGTFIMGPVSADAMYNGEYHSYNGGGKIVIGD